MVNDVDADTGLVEFEIEESAKEEVCEFEIASLPMLREMANDLDNHPLMRASLLSLIQKIEQSMK